MSTLQFTCPLIVTIPGQLIASSLWNNEFVNIFTNGNPQGIGAYSDTDPQMQTATDPFPSGSTDRPTALSGELERIRYILDLIIGKTYWYEHASVDLETIKNTYEHFASGTVLVFYQAAAPTGWTQNTTPNDAALRVVHTAGGGTGGSFGLSSSITLAHSHTVNSHTHDLGNHTHSTPSHTHDLAHTDDAVTTFPGGNEVGSLRSSGSQMYATGVVGSGINIWIFQNKTETSGAGTSGAPSSNTSGATAPGTDSKLSNIALAYIDVIVCSKN